MEVSASGGNLDRGGRTDYRVIVENLSSDIRWQDLKNYLSQAGEVKYAHKSSRNEGCVAFTSEKVNINTLFYYYDWDAVLNIAIDVALINSLTKQLILITL